MKKTMKLFLGIFAGVALLQAAVAQDEIILHSRADVAGTPTSYFDAPIVSNTSAASSVGGNAAANGGPGGSLYTSGNFNVVGVRSGAWLLDSVSVSYDAGVYDLDITWGNQSNLKVVRIEVTDALGTTVFNNVNQVDGVNTWMNLGQFTFDGGAGQEVRMFNNEGASSGNVQFDSIRLTAVPEPSTYALGALGMAMAGWAYRRRKA